MPMNARSRRLSRRRSAQTSMNNRMVSVTKVVPEMRELGSRKALPQSQSSAHSWRNIRIISSCQAVCPEQEVCAVFPAFSVGMGSLRFAPRFLTAKELHF